MHVGSMDWLDYQIELEAVLDALNAQLDVISDEAKKLGCRPHELKDSSGRAIIIDPLVAKGQILIKLYDMSKERPE